MTWQRDSSAPLRAKDGFSVVAPIKCDSAILHHRQKAILLRAVKAVDLVHEQQRSLAGAAALRGIVERALEVSNA